jgi:hypothetical protein
MEKILSLLGIIILRVLAELEYVKITSQNRRLHMWKHMWKLSILMMFRVVFWDILTCKRLSTDVSEVRTASTIRDE